MTLLHVLTILALAAFSPLAASDSLAAPDLSGKPVVCIDPGHPSEVHDGYQRQNCTTETHCNWAVAQALQRQLANAGYHVVMTKVHENEFVRNVRRAEIANRSQAALMLRLHCDTGSGAGYRIYYPNTSARDGTVVGPSSEVRERSRVAAEAIHSGLAGLLAGSLKDNGVATDRSTAVGRKMGGALIGSIHSKVPVVLVEMVVLSNPSDANFIKSRDGQEKIAAGLVAGVERFVPIASGRLNPAAGTPAAMRPPPRARTAAPTSGKARSRER